MSNTIANVYGEDRQPKIPANAAQINMSIKELKILVVGNRGVGKTCLMKQFCRATYVDDYTQTVAVDFMEKVERVGSQGIKFMVWDTAGQDGFNAVTRAYFKGAEAAVLVFSTTDRKSFEALPRWRDKVRGECGDVAMVLMQNKVDMIEQSAVSSEEAEAMARRLNLRLYRGCVREDLNVSSAFTYMAELTRRVDRSTVSTENIPDGQPGAPRASLSMSESIKMGMQQKQHRAKKDLDCLLM